MKRITAMQVLLGLIQACEIGVVTDVLWMPGADGTIFDALCHEIGVPDVDHDGSEMECDSDALRRWLTVEIEAANEAAHPPVIVGGAK